MNAPALSHWYMPSSTQVDVQLPLDLIVEPQNGTITFDMQLYTGSSILQPLPLFLTFDANNLRISGTPLAGDVGMYPLVLIGTSPFCSRGATFSHGCTRFLGIACLEPLP